MGIAKPFIKEKLIIGLLYVRESIVDTAEEQLQSVFGDIDCKSCAYNFSNISGYYDAEMGGEVYRRFVSFAQCVDPSRLAEIKLWTNRLENGQASQGCRRINLDPGLISHGKLSLATTKNAPHRIPLHSGIYAELTMFYARRQWQPLPWTYLDFKTDQVKWFLEEARRIYLQQRRLEDAE